MGRIMRKILTIGEAVVVIGLGVIGQLTVHYLLFTIHYSLFTAFLGLAKEGNKAYLQCLDPCELTGGGAVIFEVELKK